MADTTAGPARPHPGDALVRLVDMAVEVTHAERGVLLILADGDLSVRCFRDARGRDLPPNALIDLSIGRKVVRGGRPLLEAGDDDPPRELMTTGIADLTRIQVMCAPLMVEDRVLGALHVDAHSMEGRFAGDALGLLAAIADQVALALARE